MINLMKRFIVSCRDAVDIALSLHAESRRFDPYRRKSFFFLRLFCFVLFCFAFLNTYFHFLADLNSKFIISLHFYNS